MTASDFDTLVQEYHRALEQFPKGNPEPLREMYSRRDDATLANPFGPPVRGVAQVDAVLDRAAALYKDGQASAFESISKFVSADMACIVEIERHRAKVSGGQELVPIALRVHEGLKVHYDSPYTLMAVMGQNVNLNLVVGGLLLLAYGVVVVGTLLAA